MIIIMCVIYIPYFRYIIYQIFHCNYFLSIYFAECSREDVVPVLNMPQLKRLTLQSIDPLPILHSLHTRDESLERLSIRDWPHLWVSGIFRYKILNGFK